MLFTYASAVLQKCLKLPTEGTRRPSDAIFILERRVGIKKKFWLSVEFLESKFPLGGLGSPKCPNRLTRKEHLCEVEEYLCEGVEDNYAISTEHFSNLVDSPKPGLKLYMQCVVVVLLFELSPSSLSFEHKWWEISHTRNVEELRVWTLVCWGCVLWCAEGVLWCAD